MADRAVIRGFILAGGLSTRMGADKARLPDDLGWPMATAAAIRLAPFVDDVALVRREDDGLPWVTPHGERLAVVLEPPVAGRHPLWGVAAGLALGDDALFVPCDMPDLPAEVFARLRSAGPPAVARSEQGVHPLVCFLPATWAERARAIAARDGSASSLMAEARPVDLPDAWLRDVNAPAGLDRWETLEQRLRFLPPTVRARAMLGERARLAARGAVPRGAGLSVGARPPRG